MGQSVISVGDRIVMIAMFVVTPNSTDLDHCFSRWGEDEFWLKRCEVRSKLNRAEFLKIIERKLTNANRRRN